MCSTSFFSMKHASEVFRMYMYGTLYGRSPHFCSSMFRFVLDERFVKGWSIERETSRTFLIEGMHGFNAMCRHSSGFKLNLFELFSNLIRLYSERSVALCCRLDYREKIFPSLMGLCQHFTSTSFCFVFYGRFAKSHLGRSEGNVFRWIANEVYMGSHIIPGNVFVSRSNFLGSVGGCLLRILAFAILTSDMVSFQRIFSIPIVQEGEGFLQCLFAICVATYFQRVAEHFGGRIKEVNLCDFEEIFRFVSSGKALTLMKPADSLDFCLSSVMTCINVLYCLFSRKASVRFKMTEAWIVARPARMAPSLRTYAFLMNSEQHFSCENNACFFMRHFRSTMERKSSESSDTLSLDCKLLNTALGKDLDGLSDDELRQEIEELSDVSDNVNVTIREVKVPNQHVDPIQPRVASVLVVPETTKRAFKDFIPKPSTANSSTGRTTNKSKDEKKNRNGSSKRRLRKARSSGEAGSLESLLSKVTVSGKGKGNEITSTPKRYRSPGEAQEVLQPQPTKMAKMKVVLTTKPTTTSMDKTAETILVSSDKYVVAVDPKSVDAPEERSPSYSEIASKTLNLKVVLADRPPAGSELLNVKQFLYDKIEKAVEDGKYLPIFKGCYVGKDGVYTFCSDYSCAEWLKNIIKMGAPGINSKLIALPHEAPVKMAAVKDMVRVVTTLPTRNTNQFILKALAGFNKNLNTEDWRITKRRPKGASKLTLFMRMDRASFNLIGRQNGEINWILKPEAVELEKKKPKNGNVSPGGNQPTVTRNPVSGQRQQSRPSSGNEVMEVDQTVPGPILKEGSGTAGIVLKQTNDG